MSVRSQEEKHPWLLKRIKPRVRPKPNEEPEQPEDENKHDKVQTNQLKILIIYFFYFLLFLLFKSIKPHSPMIKFTLPPSNPPSALHNFPPRKRTAQNEHRNIVHFWDRIPADISKWLILSKLEIFIMGVVLGGKRLGVGVGGYWKKWMGLNIAEIIYLLK